MNKRFVLGNEIEAFANLVLYFPFPLTVQKKPEKQKTKKMASDTGVIYKSYEGRPRPDGSFSSYSMTRQTQQAEQKKEEAVWHEIAEHVPNIRLFSYDGYVDNPHLRIVRGLLFTTEGILLWWRPNAKSATREALLRTLKQLDDIAVPLIRFFSEVHATLTQFNKDEHDGEGRKISAQIFVQLETWMQFLKSKKQDKTEEQKVQLARASQFLRLRVDATQGCRDFIPALAHQFRKLLRPRHDYLLSSNIFPSLQTSIFFCPPPLAPLVQPLGSMPSLLGMMLVVPPDHILFSDLEKPTQLLQPQGQQEIIVNVDKYLPRPLEDWPVLAPTFGPDPVLYSLFSHPMYQNPAVRRITIHNLK
jgi:hypothetical protein